MTPLHERHLAALSALTRNMFPRETVDSNPSLSTRRFLSPHSPIASTANTRACCRGVTLLSYSLSEARIRAFLPP